LVVQQGAPEAWPQSFVQNAGWDRGRVVAVPEVATAEAGICLFSACTLWFAAYRSSPANAAWLAPVSVPVPRGRPADSRS
jgi:hypothetical protein